ncbi:hypothetical protein ABZP36_019184 [Zizania latifolia]
MTSGPAGDGRQGGSGPGAAAAAAVDGDGDDVLGGVPVARTIVERWKMDAAAARARLLLRALAWLFSLLALVIMASNTHGHGGAQDFNHYPEYSYCLGISVVAFLYTMAQVLRDVHRLSFGRDILAARKAAAIVDFAGDQIVAYLLMSALSAAAPVTDYMRQAADNLFTDSAAAAVGMAFFAFVTVGTSALLSGYNLSMEALV